MNDVRRDFRLHGVDFIYGTVRLIEAEHDTALPWAREDWACVDLQPAHRSSPRGRRARRRAFPPAHRPRAAPGGSYYLTYHRFASARPARAGASRHPRLLRGETRHGSGRCLPERLVSRTCGGCSHEAPHDRAQPRRGAAAVEPASRCSRARVIGQLETLLVAPDWLPDMDAWYSGLAALLPAAARADRDPDAMAVVAWNRRMRNGRFALRESAHRHRAARLRAGSISRDGGAARR